MPLDNQANSILNAPELDAFPADYFADHQKDIDVLAEHLRYFGLPDTSTQTVLEIGAGVGMHSGLLSALFARVYATDILKYTALGQGTFIKHVSDEHAHHGIPFHARKIDFITSSAMDLVLRDNVADFGVSINTFEHIPDPALALNELVRCVRPGGHLYIQFDPLWTADMGSHFLNYVPEPWGHLIYSTEEFVRRMRSAGATPYEIESFTDGINRHRQAYFQGLLDDGQRNGRFAILSQTRPEQWSGVTDPLHLDHPFLDQAIALGYTREELMLRGMRWVLRVMA